MPNADGSYAYTVANTDVQYLKSGETKTENFTIQSIDGTSKTISFTIKGADDPTQIGTPTNTSVTEDQNVVTGLLKATGTIFIGI